MRMMMERLDMSLSTTEITLLNLMLAAKHDLVGQMDTYRAEEQAGKESIAKIDEVLAALDAGINCVSKAKPFSRENR